jgi:hypothetical protein
MDLAQLTLETSDVTKRHEAQLLTLAALVGLLRADPSERVHSTLEYAIAAVGRTIDAPSDVARRVARRPTERPRRDLWRQARRRLGAPRDRRPESPPYVVVIADLLRELAGHAASAAAPGTEVVPAREALVVDEAGDWFRMPGGARVSCSHRQVLRLLLVAFAAARVGQPGQPVSHESLIQSGWPEERMSPVSGRNRLKQSIAVLRRLGLGDVLKSTRGGYLFSQDVPLQLARA